MLFMVEFLLILKAKNNSTIPTVKLPMPASTKNLL